LGDGICSHVPVTSAGEGFFDPESDFFGQPSLQAWLGQRELIQAIIFIIYNYVSRNLRLFCISSNRGGGASSLDQLMKPVEKQVIYDIRKLARVWRRFAI
jgi:hypothetical protein